MDTNFAGCPGMNRIEDLPKLQSFDVPRTVSMKELVLYDEGLQGETHADDVGLTWDLSKEPMCFSNAEHDLYAFHRSMISLAHNDRSSYDDEIPQGVAVKTHVAFSELPVDIESTPSPCTEPNYATLVFNALHNSPKQTMSLMDLYAWFQSNTSKTDGKRSRAWKNSIRHILSVKKVGLSLIRYLR
jgi:hypothetical protein